MSVWAAQLFTALEPNASVRTARRARRLPFADEFLLLELIIFKPRSYGGFEGIKAHQSALK
jgi:hypothetical protein